MPNVEDPISIHVSQEDQEDNKATELKITLSKLDARTMAKSLLRLVEGE
jgi:hypothetical protein